MEEAAALSREFRFGHCNAPPAVRSSLYDKMEELGEAVRNARAITIEVSLNGAEEKQSA